MIKQHNATTYEILISLYDGKAVGSVVAYGGRTNEPKILETHEKTYDATRHSDKEYLSYIYKTFYKEVRSLFSVHYNHIEAIRVYLFVSSVSHLPRQANIEKKVPFTVSEELLSTLFQNEKSLAKEHPTFASYSYVPLPTVCLGIVCDAKRTYLFPQKSFSCSMDIYTAYIPAWYKVLLEHTFGEYVNKPIAPLHIESGFVPLIKALIALFPDQSEFSLLIPGVFDVEYVSFSKHLLDTHARIAHTLPEIIMKHEKVYTRMVSPREHKVYTEKIRELLVACFTHDAPSTFLRPLFIIGDTPFSSITKTLLGGTQTGYLPITVAEQVGHIAVSDKDRKDVSSIITSMILLSRS